MTWSNSPGLQIDLIWYCLKNSTNFKLSYYISNQETTEFFGLLFLADLCRLQMLCDSFTWKKTEYFRTEATCISCKIKQELGIILQIVTTATVFELCWVTKDVDKWIIKWFCNCDGKSFKPCDPERLNEILRILSEYQNL